MSMEPATQAGASRPAKARRGWTLGIGDAETVLTGARRALFVMTGILVVIWALQIANYADSYQLTQTYGIVPRDVSRLPDILLAPLLHFSWTHIEGNSGPLFIFGFLAAYRGIGKFAAVTAIVVLTSGFAAWFFGTTNSVGAGASGVVFGYFGYIMVRGLFDRHVIDLLLGAVMALCFAYQFAVLLPHQHVGWQAHVGGLLGGIVSGWLLRDRRESARAVTPAKASAAVEPAGSVWLPSASGSQTAKSGPAKTRTAKGEDFAVDPSNPRADLYKQLDDMGL
jgi:membrane associated rhomboid family serine protease